MNSDADKNTLLLVNQKLNIIKISGSGSKQLILIRLSTVDHAKCPGYGRSVVEHRPIKSPGTTSR